MRLAIISGGSRGLGLALCQHFGAAGYRVLEFSRSAPHDYSVRVDFSAPLSSRAAMRPALQGLAAEGPWERIVAVANAAVITPIGPTSRQASEEIVRNLDASFTSSILFITEVIAAFQTQPGAKAILNISSGAALRGQPGVSLYCAAKAGLENFIRAVASEQEHEQFPLIAANVDPGAMETAMQDAILGSSREDFPDIDRFVQRQQAGALRRPAAVAEAIARIAAMPELTGGARYSVGDYGA